MTRSLFAAWRVALVATLVLASSSLAAFRTDQPASAQPTDSASTQSVTAVRTHLDNGTDTVAFSETVKVTVAQTTNLRDRQSIDVSWSGAHPTQGIIADSNSGSATQQEYPMVFLQCRGTAVTITPETCWAQSETERYSADNDKDNPFPPWRLDRYAAPQDRKALAGGPDPRPNGCGTVPAAEHWTPFVAADGTKYFGGPANACGGLPPEASSLDGTLALPSNTTYAATGLDGTGETSFNVRDATDNASLGCSDQVACALVAVPIVGISCDVAATSLPDADRPVVGTQADAAAGNCKKAGFFPPGQLVSNPQNLEDLSVSGGLWWSASNWRNHLTFPLSFAPPANVCDLSSTRDPTLVYGSELMIQATTSWAPHFCLDSNLAPFKHVQTGEPQARNLLGQGAIQAAMTSGPPGTAYSKPTVHAPIAASGFAIAFTVDNNKRDPVTSLKLDARLLAKLMTESYPAIIPIKSDYAALKNNPLDMSTDPEFIALNPDIPQGVANGISASALYSVSSDSDVISALTAYINADPEARQWLDGKPDPWGMVVNPNYKGIALPVDSWPLLDSYEPTSYYQPGVNDCLAESPVPFLPLVASPTSRLANISLAMQFAIANAQVTCSQPVQGTTAGQKLVAIGRQTKGFRFMIGLTSIADAERYGLSVAALETQSSVSPTTKITDATGRTFVAPTDASLKAATDTLAPDPETKSWPIDYAALRSDAKNADAYPGTMLVYADIPTTGLTSTDASALSELLDFAAGAGQTPGDTAGQLPPGYLPMTSANGLTGLLAYTKAAAVDVKAQNGVVPTLAGVNTPPTSDNGDGTGGDLSGDGSGSGSDGGSGADGSGSDSSSAPSSPSSGAPSSGAPSSAPAALVGKTTGQRSQSASLLLILLLALVVLGPIAAPITLYAVRRRAMR